MPYHSYIPWLVESFFPKFENIKILEIGVCSGQMMLPICHFFGVARKPYIYVGLDVKINDNLKSILNYWTKQTNQHIFYEIKNSLDWLPKCEDQFDLILILIKLNYIL